MGEPSRRRVTYGQLEHLWEFLDKRKDIATGYNKTSQAREFSRKMWEEIALSLNSHGDGAVKDWKGWCKYWNDYKSKLKKLAAATKSSQQKTGGGQSNIKQMTDLEKKFLQILGDDFGAGLPGIRVEPFEEEVCVNQVEINITTPTEIHRTPLNSGCSESILTGVYFDPQPGPSWRNDYPILQATTPSNSHHTHVTNTPHTPSHSPRRSPRRHQHTPRSHTFQSRTCTPTTPRRSPRRRLLASPHVEFTPTLLPAQPSSTVDTLHTTLSRPTQPRPIPSPQHQPAPTSPHTQRTPVRERRRRIRREPPMTMENARRALIMESQKQTKIQEEKLNLFRIMINEIREIKEIIRTRFE